MNKSTALPSTTSAAAKFYYGVGAVAYGIKEHGFAYLLLIYYSQVLGLPQNLVGAGIFIALLFDAVTDPIVGTASDNLHSRWGRRHPFMYASALPVAIGYFFLWSPPAGLSNGALFAYFVTLAVLVRISITFYEIPSSALVAELTDDYHERTSFLSLRYFFGWWGGLSVSVFTFSVLLVPTEEYPVGVLNPHGYETYGALTSVLMLAAILLSSLGTHKYIPQLKKPQQTGYLPIRTLARQTLETISEGSFRALFISAMFGALASGLSTSMSVYINTFYWELDNKQIAMVTSTIFFSAIVAVILAPRIGRYLGKKHAAITIGVISAVVAPLPYILRILDLFPANGSSELLYCLIVYQLVEMSLMITTAIMVDSMIADVVEQSQLRTGRRSEGVFFAARSFIRKSVSGVGVLLATTLLTLINFPTDAKPGMVEPGVVDNLGVYYAPAIFVLYMLAIIVIFAYRISQEIHEENVRSLASDAGASM
jgi:GPH family glycoside/pentoside/hexuronide:cation symporter